MKFYLSFIIAGILIICLLRFRYATPEDKTVSDITGQSFARMGMQEMNNISKDRESIKKAITNFNRALKLDPQDQLALFGLGWALQSEGKDSAAEELYLQAVAQNKEICKYLHFNLSLIKEKNNDLVSAIEENRSALACEPSFKAAQDRELLLSTLVPKPTQAPQALTAAKQSVSN